MDHSWIGQQQFSSENHQNDSKDIIGTFPPWLFLKAGYIYIILGLFNSFCYLGNRLSSSTSPKFSRTWVTFDPLLRNKIILPFLPSFTHKGEKSRSWALPLAFSNIAIALHGHFLSIRFQNACSHMPRMKLQVLWALWLSRKYNAFSRNHGGSFGSSS